MLLRFILLYGVWITGLKKTRDMSAKKLTFHLQQERLLLAPRRTELFDCPQEQGPRTLRFWPTGLKEKVCCRLFQNFADKKKNLAAAWGGGGRLVKLCLLILTSSVSPVPSLAHWQVLHFVFLLMLSPSLTQQCYSPFQPPKTKKQRRQYGKRKSNSLFHFFWCNSWQKQKL